MVFERGKKGYKVGLELPSLFLSQENISSKKIYISIYYGRDDRDTHHNILVFFVSKKKKPTSGQKNSKDVGEAQVSVHPHL